MLYKLKDANLETRTWSFLFLTCRICQRWCSRGQKSRGVENGYRERIRLLHGIFSIFTFRTLGNWSLGRIFSVSRQFSGRRSLLFLLWSFNIPDIRQCEEQLMVMVTCLLPWQLTGVFYFGVGFFFLNSYVSKHLTVITSQSERRSCQSSPGSALAVFMGHNFKPCLQVSLMYELAESEIRLVQRGAILYKNFI